MQMQSPRVAPMIEQRAVPRHKVFKAGVLAFGQAGVTCIVRNMSSAGACLEAEATAAIPRDFTLAIACDGLIRRCHVVWRKDRRIGVAFD
jgi:hypothetical protein